MKKAGIAIIFLFAIMVSNSFGQTTALTNGVWMNDNIASGVDAKLYTFAVTRGTTYFVWWNDADVTSSNVDIVVSASYMDGPSIFTREDVSWSSPQSFTADRNGTVLLIANPYSSGSTGTFSILFSTNSSRPSTPPPTPTAVTAISDGVWTHSRMTNGAPLWFSFNVRMGTTYRVWWDDSDVTSSHVDILVTAHYQDGTEIFERIDSSWSSPQMFTANRNGTVFLRADPYSSGSSGPFAILFSTNSTRPARPPIPPPTPTAVTALRIGSWTNSRMTNGESVWFSFEARLGTTYRVWWDDMDVTSSNVDIRVTAHYQDGTEIFDGVDSTEYGPEMFTANRNGRVFLRADPYSSGNSGPFAIGVTTNDNKPR